MQVASHFFADFCKIWVISAMDIDFRLKDAYEIQEYPKIIIANKNLKLEDYMRNLGYEPVETDNDSISENIYEFKASESGSFVEVTKHINFYVWMWRE